ncbi:18633_t:CDS:2 [Funneliformis geosporum]|uniref:18633_t:CDS:1 n=1 Tax=Funneliformis geosporum TaxID=1117311 RepID=A0A9W4SUZ3_9GLOM|nr:18633_t:CDS:2 [Funneliformis geosporum]
MRLEYRVLEIAKDDEQECNFCFLDFDNPTNFSLDTIPTTHQCYLKAKSTKQISDKELLSQAFSSRLEKKTRELKKSYQLLKKG